MMQQERTRYIAMKGMKRAFVIVVSVGVLIILFSVAGFYNFRSQDVYAPLNDIGRKEILNQKEDDYYVYFYKQGCPYCKKIQDSFLDFAGDHIVYIVDMDKKSNNKNKYNWEEHSELYDIEIGEVDAKGNIRYYPGESEEKYVNSEEYNIYGKKNVYSIKIADESYVAKNKNAEIGKVYAKLDTPVLNYQAMDSDSIMIAGSPTLLHIKEHKIVNDYFDSTEIQEFFDSLNQ